MTNFEDREADAGLDVERLARALCRVRWPADPDRFDADPDFWRSEAAAYAREYAALGPQATA